jgi:hypothetical protein
MYASHVEACAACPAGAVGIEQAANPFGLPACAE